MDLDWKEPERENPYVTGRGIAPLLNWHAVADALRTRPGQFALVKTDCDEQNAWRINKGRNAAFRDERFEAVIRNRGAYEHEHHGDLYVRYLGPKEQ